MEPEKITYLIQDIPNWALDLVIEKAPSGVAALTGTIRGRLELMDGVPYVQLWSTTGHIITPSMLLP